MANEFDDGIKHALPSMLSAMGETIYYYSANADVVTCKALVGAVKIDKEFDGGRAKIIYRRDVEVPRVDVDGSGAIADPKRGAKVAFESGGDQWFIEAIDSQRPGVSTLRVTRRGASDKHVGNAIAGA